ncbi:unnamed protein product [Absidia cylindrospora]
MKNNTEPSEQPQTETLPVNPSSETVSLDYNTLNLRYTELAKQDNENRQELERLRSLLQQEKDTTDNKMEDITNSKHESVTLASDLRQSLALLRSENATISQDKKESYLKVIKLQTEGDAKHYQNESLKLQVNDLQLRLKKSIKNEEGVRQSLLVAENELKLQSESKRRDRELLWTQKSDIEKERNSLSTTVQTLQHELTTHKNDLRCANERAKTAEERCHQLEASQATIMKNHKELIEVYEKQRLEAEERIANFTAEVELTQQKATTNQAQLEHDNKTLKTQLDDALERLQASRNSLDQLFGNSSSSDSTTSTNTTSTLTSSGASGNLLKLMKQYENTGKHWDDIYGDFFQLQDTTTRLTAINNELTTVNRQLVREKDDQQQYHNQLESEVERLRTERASQSSISDDFTKLKISSAHQISQLKNTIDKLERTKQDLSASLNDTSYQLRYLLQHVESQNGSLPSEVQQKNDSIENAQTPVPLGHQKTIFNNISDLQQRNQELMIEIRHLSTQLEEKTTEANTYAMSAKDANDLLTDTSAKSTTLIRDQNEKLKTLELRLSMAISERDRLLKEVPESNHDSIVPSITGETQEQPNPVEQKYQNLVTETEAYRQEVVLEIQELRQEISKTRTEAVDAEKKYNQSLLEINQLRQRNIGLVQVSSSRQNEIEELRRRATTREGYVGELESRILALNDEILTLNRNIENLRNDNLSTSAQLKASDDSYQRLLLENKELTNHRTHMAALLQDMNENMGSSTTGTTKLIEKINQHNEHLSSELQNLRDTLATKEKQLSEFVTINQQDWKGKYQTTNDELKQMKAEYLDLEKKLGEANQDRIVAQAKLTEITQKAQDTTTDGSDTPETVEKNGSDDAISEQVKQLAEANDLVVSLKKEVFELKERLTNADSTTNTITENYNKFTEESQIRIDKLSSDLAASNTKVDNLQVELEKVLTEQKEVKALYTSSQQQLDATNAKVALENEQWEAKTTTLSTRISVLETELADSVQERQQAEQRYQDEVSGRAQDAEVITQLRAEVQGLNVNISTLEAQVQDTKERLESAESLHKNQQEQWESAQNDMKTRLDESQKQQESLSGKIEELVTKLNQLKSSPDSVDPEAITILVESATQQAQDINASLRRERDVWQARYNDAQQRATRVESDLEFMQQQLSTTRSLLDNMRAEKEDATKRQDQQVKNATNEASLYKENNAVLRNQVEQLEKRVTELESLVATKETELEPLTLKTRGLEQELKESKELVKTLQVKQEDWSANSASLLSKQNKQDPQELDRLKTEIETAKAQLDEKITALNSMEKQHQEVLTKANRTEEQLKKANEMYVQRSKLALEFKKKAADLEATVKTQKEQLDEHQKGQSGVQQNKQESDNSEKIKEMEEALNKHKEDHNALVTKYHNLLLRARQLSAEKNTLSTSLEPLQKESTELKEQMEALKTEMEQLKQQLATKTDEAAKTANLQVEIGRMRAIQSMANNKNEKLKKQVTELQQQLQEQTSSSSSSSTAITQPDTAASSSSTNTTVTPSSGSVQVPETQSTDTTSTSAESTNSLKRAPEEELDGQSPVKK